MFDLISDWEFISFYIFLGLLLFIAKVIKEKVPFLNRIIVPSALIAGFIGLLLSDGFFNIVNLSDSNGERYPIIFETVYHALAIGFIALTLRREENPADKKVWSTGMVIVITYLLQALVGVTIVYLLFKDTFLGAGLLLPLGFGQGPGLATTQGAAYAANLYESGLSFLPHGGALGASIASMGFLVGGIIGVIALNYLARKSNLDVDKFHREESLVTENFEVETIKEIRVFDALTMQIVIIFLIYGCVYLTLAGLENLLYSFDNSLANTFAGVFHGFNFLIGIVYALIYRRGLTVAEKKGKNVKFLTNNYILSNISSIAFNFMIIASVLTITASAVETYYLLVIVFALVGTLVTLTFVKWISKKIYSGPNELNYFLGMFGMLTGTASTGLALLKGVDKDFKSPVAEEMVVGSGTAISMALPLFALLMFPTLAVETGEGIYTALVFIIPAVYGLLLLGVLLFINRNK